MTRKLVSVDDTTVADNDIAQRKSGSWVNRTLAQLKTDLAITLNSLLPTQAGQSGKYLSTDGTNASWGTPAGGGGSARFTQTNITTGTPSFTLTGRDLLVGTSLTANITAISWTGTAQDGDQLFVLIKDNGTSRTFTPGSSFQNSDSATAPGATTVGKYHLLGYVRVEAVSKYVLASYMTFS